MYVIVMKRRAPNVMKQQGAGLEPSTFEPEVRRAIDWAAKASSCANTTPSFQRAQTQGRYSIVASVVLSTHALLHGTGLKDSR